LKEGKHFWKVKIIKVVASTDVGVISPIHSSHFNLSTPTAWGIRENGWSYYEKHNSGMNFKDGDILSFSLDLNAKTLMCWINNILVPFTHSTVIAPVHISFSGSAGASAEIIS
jgi:hypothetical protein